MAQNFKTIRAAIKQVIDDQVEVVKVAYNYDRSTFEKFPAIVIAPSDNEADYGSTDNDKIQFVFKLRAYYPIQKEEEHQKAEEALEAVVDELLTVFANRKALGAACDWVGPVPSVWLYEERGEAVYRTAEITLRCIKYVQHGMG